MPHPSPGQLARMEDPVVNAILTDLITINRVLDDILPYAPESAEGTPRRFEEQETFDGERWDGLS